MKKMNIFWAVLLIFGSICVWVIMGNMSLTRNTRLTKLEDRVTKINVVFPGMPGSFDRQTIKEIVDSERINSILELTRSQTKDKSGWTRVDSSLTAVSLIKLDFLDGAQMKGSFGFNADFNNMINYKDIYGFNGNYFELFSPEGHYKKEAHLTEIRNLMKLVDISEEDYISIEKSWISGKRWISGKEHK